ncbi:hypothetical protein POVWA2_030050 [Plasmodium ovale wallikeri]|uniref:Uncharacterized protein n=1 Tax=Plasmodium ovale wallikeri TaxID=864142 RepID=A0A1A8YWU8_PLAOA|nr:hypothetical protein POVWA1_030460 [Plasmodium ovale wallikeri]SBT36419.1 hypothetical protein POVWA2_030050 [Plasmodium ovale wallikeri]
MVTFSSPILATPLYAHPLIRTVNALLGRTALRHKHAAGSSRIHRRVVHMCMPSLPFLHFEKKKVQGEWQNKRCTGKVQTPQLRVKHWNREREGQIRRSALRTGK